MIYLLNRNPVFPDPMSIPEEDRESDGCIAVGGDLSETRLLEAYSQGIFPWSAFRDPELLWYCPMRRFVIFTDAVHVSHSMRSLINKKTYKVTFDTDFGSVISHCSRLRIHQSGAWLGPEMIKAYTMLHHDGYAHSVEVWRDSNLVGGLYGVGLMHGFFGESMFSLEPNTSKLALISLCRALKLAGVPIVDCQFETPHLKSMGGRHISYEEYMHLIWCGSDDMRVELRDD